MNLSRIAKAWIAFGGLTISALALTASVALRPQAASLPAWLNYQGRITTPDKAAVADGQYDAVFKLFDSPTGGNLLWSESTEIAAIDGVFNTTLGQTAAFPSDLFTRRLWLQTEIEGRTLVPRQELGSVAYAMTAQNVPDGSITNDKLQDAAVTTQKIADASVTESKLADGSVSTEKIQDLSVIGSKIAPNSISGDHLQSGAVGFEQLGRMLHVTQTARPYLELNSGSTTNLGTQVTLALPRSGSVLVTVSATFRTTGAVSWVGVMPAARQGATKIDSGDWMYEGMFATNGTQYWSISTSAVLNLPTAGTWDFIIEVSSATSTAPIVAHTYTISAVYLGPTT